MHVWTYEWAIYVYFVLFKYLIIIMSTAYEFLPANICDITEWSLLRLEGLIKP